MSDAKEIFTRGEVELGIKRRIDGELNVRDSIFIDLYSSTEGDKE